MNELDFAVIIASIFGIALYGIWYTRNRTDLNSYLRGSSHTPWYVIGISVMATQASAITFLSTPGQGYLNGLGFLQIYFGVPIALLIISQFFLPIFHKLNVYTAYEFLETRFDTKTRLLGAILFLLQRGIGAGLTIYAPAIVLSTVLGWSLQVTIISCGLLVILYTVIGGSDAVTVTQKYQMLIIFCGMATAVYVLLHKLPSDLSFGDTVKIAGGFQKLNSMNFSFSVHDRYTFWSGLLGGTFLMLSYFGTDQSQVQRYLAGSSLRESRLGLLFNAVLKIPMQFSILSLGVLLFVFYQFNQPPIFFDSTALTYLNSHHEDKKLTAFEQEFNTAHARCKANLASYVKAQHASNGQAAEVAFVSAAQAQQDMEKIRQDAEKEVALKSADAKANDADYVFITFILQQMPHGAIGLLVAAFFAAALSSKAAELNALGTSTTIDFYRLLINPDATEHQCLIATKWFTAVWGILAVIVALCAHLAENLIQAVNIIGSIFYGVMLALFIVAFFIKNIQGTAIFWAAIVTQTLVFVLYFTLSISYLWYPLIGCLACIALSALLQITMRNNRNVVKEYAS